MDSNTIIKSTDEFVGVDGELLTQHSILMSDLFFTKNCLVPVTYQSIPKDHIFKLYDVDEYEESSYNATNVSLAHYKDPAGQIISSGWMMVFTDIAVEFYKHGNKLSMMIRDKKTDPRRENSFYVSGDVSRSNESNHAVKLFACNLNIWPTGADGSLAIIASQKEYPNKANRNFCTRLNTYHELTGFLFNAVDIKKKTTTNFAISRPTINIIDLKQQLQDQFY